MIVTRGQTVVMWRVHMNVHAKRDSVVMDISVVEVGNTLISEINASA